jgi:hypothetical protein
MKTHRLSLLLSAVTLNAQDTYTLDWSSFTGGGKTQDAEAGEYTIESSLGQMGAQEPPAGATGEFSVSGGYWTFTLNEPLDLGLTMQLTGGNVSLAWDDSTGIPVRLESSVDLQLWEPVTPQPQHPPFLEATFQRRYYRLMPVP